MVRDLTSGSPWKHVVAMALPLLWGNVFQATYNLVDTIIVGRFVGAHALAGVGIASPVFNLLNALLIGLSMGSSIFVSQLFGAKKQKELSQAVSTLLWMSLGLAVLLTILGMLFTQPFLTLLKTPQEDYAYAEIYLRTILAGLVCNVFYNQLTGMLRGLGNTKAPLYFLIISCCINAGLDVVFVCYLKMGVFGAGLATVIAEGISALLTGIYIIKKIPQLHIHGARGLDKDVCNVVMRLGLPMGLQQASISMGHVLMQGLINPFGTALIDGYTAAAKVDMFAVMPIISIAAALSAFSAQNAGGQNWERVREGYRTGCKMVVGVCVILILLVVPLREFWIGIFLSEQTDIRLAAEIIMAGSGMLALTPIFYWGLGLIHVTLNTMAGTGDTVFSMKAMVGMMFLRVLIAWGLIQFEAMGFWGIWWSFPISWMITLVFTLYHYKQGTWIEIGVRKFTTQE